MSSRLGIALFLALAGCLDTSSNTDLVDFGPPEVAQVRLDENLTGSSGTVTRDRVFAFGTQPSATAAQEHAVTTAAATGQNGEEPLKATLTGGGLRIIMDQLLRGNRLQQIQCRGNVALDGSGNPEPWSSVSDDATPDDIAKCAESDAALPATCFGSNATCLCEIPGGCDGVAFGAAVGVLDLNSDGAADSMRFMPNAVELVCGEGSDRSIVVPADLLNSYWDPAGNQLVPAVGSFDAIGPAIVFIPDAPVDPTDTLTGVLPANTTCNLKFDPSVVDKSDLQICAVPGGRPADCTDRLADCPQFFDGCTPGDVSAFSFGVEPMTLLATDSFNNDVDGYVGFPLMGDDIFINTNVTLDPNSVGGVTFTPTPSAGAPTISPNSSQIMISPNAGLDPSTEYTITVPTTVTDLFGQSATAPYVVHFTTAAM